MGKPLQTVTDRSMLTQNYPHTWQREIASAADQGLEAQEEIIETMEKHDFSERALFSTRLALTEAITNAIRHGNRMQADKTVQIDWGIDSKQIEIVITDQGSGFDPEQLIDPTAIENLERAGGRGVMLMRNFMDTVEYNEVGNSVRFIKKRD